MNDILLAAAIVLLGAAHLMLTRAVNSQRRMLIMHQQTIAHLIALALAGDDDEPDRE